MRIRRELWRQRLGRTSGSATSRRRSVVVGVIALHAWLLMVSGAASGQPLCGDIVFVATPAIGLGSRGDRERRVEVRRCGEDRSHVLQIAAWVQGEVQPSLLLDTDRFSHSQSYASGDVVAFEFGGGGTNILYVVAFSEGKVRLAYRGAYKAYARFVTGRQELRVEVPVEGEPMRVMTFATGIQ